MYLALSFTILESGERYLTEIIKKKLLYTNIAIVYYTECSMIFDCFPYFLGLHLTIYSPIPHIFLASFLGSLESSH